MLEKVMARTSEYIASMPKEIRKKYGQFFTGIKTARFMAGIFDVSPVQEHISILDPGSGSGILACALVERLEKIDEIKTIKITCYENDSRIIKILKENLQLCKAMSSKNIDIEIIEDNYILAQSMEFNFRDSNAEKFDFIIANPPYMKISKTAEEAAAMPTVCYGTPNLYFLFASMSLFNLRSDGEMVYIMPRSWTSGAYFTKFRKYLLSEGEIKHIHLFVSRDKVFEKENVLQETMILKVKKNANHYGDVVITSSVSSNDFSSLKKMSVAYDSVVSGEDKFIFLPTCEKEVDVLKKMKRWENTLPSLGLRMKTGLTVDFRNYESLTDIPSNNTVPIFYSQHLHNGLVQFPLSKGKEYIFTEKSGLLQQNKNYLFVKRFASKEEPRRLQSAIYLAKTFSQYSKISTQNKINFIDSDTCELSECVVYGLYVLFNSTLYDIYYRILNGSTQVNSTEINAMPVPCMDDIQNMGKRLMKLGDLSERCCDKILEEYCG